MSPASTPWGRCWAGASSGPHAWPQTRRPARSWPASPLASASSCESTFAHCMRLQPDMSASTSAALGTCMHADVAFALPRTREDVDDVRREVQIIHNLKGHPNIVTLIGAFEDKHAVHLVGFRVFLPDCRSVHVPACTECAALATAAMSATAARFSGCAAPWPMLGTPVSAGTCTGTSVSLWCLCIGHGALLRRGAVRPHRGAGPLHVRAPQSPLLKHNC